MAVTTAQIGFDECVRGDYARAEMWARDTAGYLHEATKDLKRYGRYSK